MLRYLAQTQPEYPDPERRSGTCDHTSIGYAPLVNGVNDALKITLPPQRQRATLHGMTDR
jgi:hypothetical protein